MALMHFYAQMGQIRVGPYLLAMPDEMDEADREHFTEMFRRMEADPGSFERFVAGLDDRATAEKIQNMAERYMDEVYPMPLDRVVTSFHASTFQHKDYYLPALKVLNLRDGVFYSPARTAAWKNNELIANHLEVEENDPTTRKYVVNVPKRRPHKPSLECDCGIYGSVNTEEIGIYLNYDGDHSMVMMDPNFSMSERRLVLIEPSNKADVFIARKGWKASKAFISEIVGETISFPDASELLSMVWQRPVDVAKAAMRKVMLP